MRSTYPLDTLLGVMHQHVRSSMTLAGDDDLVFQVILALAFFRANDATVHGVLECALVLNIQVCTCRASHSKVLSDFQMLVTRRGDGCVSERAMDTLFPRIGVASGVR